MSMRVVIAVAALGLCCPTVGQAASTDELSEIRRQMEELRNNYETQLKLLEKRLERAEALAEENRSEMAKDEVRDASRDAGRRGSMTLNGFNPALSFVLQGSVNSYSKDPEDYALSGFQLGGEAGLPAEGFTLDETELTASANVDHVFYAETTIGLHDDEEDTEVEVEEAFVDPLLLPAGLGSRFGRFYSGVGYLNKFHTHAWDFHDEPLAYRAFLGKQYRDDGVRLSWTAPTGLYFMLGGETLAGRQFPAGRSESVMGDVQTLFAKLGGDIGSNHSWQAGISALFADVNEREGGGHQHGGADSSNVFSGDSDLLMADFIWKWAPDGNPRQRNFKLQSEFFYRDEDGDVVFSEGGDQALLDYDGKQSGWYAQAVYQFIPRWRLGLRYDWLNPDNDLDILDLGGFTDPDEVISESGFDDTGNPKRWSAMLDWSPSEFSRLRGQYNRDESTPGKTDNQWSLQYIMSLGAHGAHAF